MKYRALSSELNEFKGTFILFIFFSCSNLYSLSYCQLFSSKLKSLCWFSGLCGFCFYSSFIYYIATAASRSTVKTISIKFFWIIVVILIALAFQLKPKKNQLILKTAVMVSFLNQWLKMSSSSDQSFYPFIDLKKEIIQLCSRMP